MLLTCPRGNRKCASLARSGFSPTELAENPGEPRGFLHVPGGIAAAPTSNDDEALKRKREEIRQRLLRGEKVVVDKSGSMQVPSSENRDAIQVPPGKLAVSDPNDWETLPESVDRRVQTILDLVREYLHDLSSSSLDNLLDQKTSIREVLSNLASHNSGDEVLKRRREEMRRRLLGGEKVAVDSSLVISKPNDDEALRRMRERIRKALLQGEPIVVDRSGSMQVSTTHGHGDQVPPDRFAWPASSDDEASKRKREKVGVDESGSVQVSSSETRDAIQVPPGQLAASFYWYENDRELYQAEVEQMRRSFPRFTLQREDDGRLAWIGSITPGLLESDHRSYTLQVVYENDHPSTSTYGGSVKVYSIDPDLEEFTQIELLPHLLRDSQQQLYLCTNRTDDFRRGGDSHASAASAVAWAVKWFAVFEMWLNGDVSKGDFSSHLF